LILIFSSGTSPLFFTPATILNDLYERCWKGPNLMNAVEFTTELRPDRVLVIPPSALGQVPTSGTARVIVLIADNAAEQDGEASAQDLADANWHDAAYAQFLSDDDSQDDIYGSCV